MGKKGSLKRRFLVGCLVLCDVTATLEMHKYFYQCFSLMLDVHQSRATRQPATPSNCREVLSGQWYRCLPETASQHRGESRGYGNNPLNRDDRQPSPTGFARKAYGCSSQTRCRWVLGVGLLPRQRLRYSRPPLKGVSLGGAAHRGGESPRKGGIMLGPAGRGPAQYRIVRPPTPEHAIIVKQNSPSVGLFTRQ